MIESNAKVAELAGAILPHPRIAVDTEADSMHCYFEKLCLIQVSVPGVDELVDPLAEGVDLSPLMRVFEQREIVLQGADYDLRLMQRAGLQLPVRVFDTMIAARLVGIREFSLAALLERFFGIKLAKGSQKANWAKRPLTPLMEEYAQNDTRYLLDLSMKLEDQLRERGRWEWFQQSCERAVEQAGEQRERDPEQVWRITGSNKLSPRAAAILRRLWHWRDGEARRTDRPAFHIFHNDQLLRAALELEETGRFTYPRGGGSRERRFSAAVEEALAIPEDEWPRKVRGGRGRLLPEQEAQVKAYRKKRDEVADALDIDGSILAPKAVLEMLVRDRDSTLAELLPWQRDLLVQAGV